MLSFCIRNMEASWTSCSTTDIYVILDLLTTGIARPAKALVPNDINTVVQEFCHLKDQHFWTCVYCRGKTCFCCTPQKGSEVQLKLQTSGKDCTHWINHEISNVQCKVTLTNVAKIERKTIIIEKIELHVRHATGLCTGQSAVRWVARKGRIIKAQ